MLFCHYQQICDERIQIRLMHQWVIFGTYLNDLLNQFYERHVISISNTPISLNYLFASLACFTLSWKRCQSGVYLAQSVYFEACFSRKSWICCERKRVVFCSQSQFIVSNYCQQAASLCACDALSSRDAKTRSIVRLPPHCSTTPSTKVECAVCDEKIRCHFCSRRVRRLQKTTPVG